MPQTITTSVRALVEAAIAEIDNLSVAQARALHGRDDVVFVDLRDIRELQREGVVPGAFHCPRGMLEFWIDPQSPYHKKVFAQDKTFVFFCAAGQRSALAAQAAQRMGLKPVAHITGGFGAWKSAGGPVENKIPESMFSSFPVKKKRDLFAAAKSNALALTTRGGKNYRSISPNFPPPIGNGNDFCQLGLFFNACTKRKKKIC